MPFLDAVIRTFDQALRTVAGVPTSSRRSPAHGMADAPLDDSARRHSAGLMRVNHVGEVCAQALYDSQGRFAHGESMKRQFAKSAIEEQDHLAWTAERLRELNSHISLLNPIWYAGAYVIGTLAARAGDAYSLGFVVETERQVEAHLASHLDRLPAGDAKSRAIVDQMRVDEIEHGAAAHALGAAELPGSVRVLMRAAAKVMTTTAYYV
ncbi:2-polyprenyl-3-methyl-6-methoxy-1,4-benzoquinone monooxygenase [Oxalobacteraceae bacterium OM1]|nr:2-polyprenyl-3-methyl-6-methoxy-1,4-benzoquinone monooxygenase [Oxalobacteraceae bacterium OM1]